MQVGAPVNAIILSRGFAPSPSTVICIARRRHSQTAVALPIVFVIYVIYVSNPLHSGVVANALVSFALVPGPNSEWG